ncbi:hypothetical protein D3C72_218990 [compost metagenome]
MDIAVCTEDGRTYTAIEFAAQDQAAIGRKRRFLQCIGCEGPAFFRKATRGGRAACFGARPHIGNCDFAALDQERRGDGPGEDQDALYNHGNRIVVDLNFGAPDRPEHETDPRRAPNPQRMGRYVGDGNRPNAEMHRRLSTLLRTLIDVPNFQYSDQLIVVGNNIEIPVRDFFVPLLNVTPQYAGQFKGYWGLLSDAAFDNSGTLWLNSGGRDNISFCLGSDQVELFSDRHRIEEEEDLAGSYILVFGEPRISQYGKLFCQIADLAYVTVRLT